MSALFLFAAAFLACAVETVEALTIVLAVGLVRGWRSTLVGVAAALLALAALVAVLGPALRLLPIDLLRLVVGALLLTLGLQWLRKAILRASGYRALRDEDAAFLRRREQAAAAAETSGPAARLDGYAFTLAFKGVLLEGLEVVFIVISFGGGQGRLPLAATAAATALVVIAGVGALVRAPLARVPENRIKFAVGVMLTSFGCYWAVEGTGVRWPGDELSLLGLVAFTATLALGLVRLLRRQRLAAEPLGLVEA
jgi:uncharacterized membrane protein